MKGDYLKDEWGSFKVEGNQKISTVMSNLKNLCFFVLILLAIFHCVERRGKSDVRERTYISLGNKGTIKGLIVPAYAWWGVRDFWDKLKSVEGVKMIVIFNPQSGPGDEKDENWEKLISFFKSMRHIPVGYVHTSYGKKSTTEVKREIDLWLEFYPEIEGFFIDEVSENLDYYKFLWNYIKRKGNFVVILNPGTTLPEKFDDISDVIVYYEGEYIAYYEGEYSNILTNTWSDGAVIIHSFEGEVGKIIGELEKRKVNWFWITDDTLPNPYDKIPTYFDEILEKIKLKQERL